MEIGRVLALQNHTVTVRGLACRVGERLEVGGVPAEVVGFTKKHVLATLLGDPGGLGPGTEALPMPLRPSASRRPSPPWRWPSTCATRARTCC